MNKKVLVLALFLVVQFSAHSSRQFSLLKFKNASDGVVSGLKIPGFGEEGKAIKTFVVAPLKNVSLLGGYDELLQYVLPTPNQEGAGSCLYMSLSGIATWWYSKLHPSLSIRQGGDTDLSPRHLMTLAGLNESSNGVANWKTDSIYLYNQSRHSYLNREIPFTRGWFKTNQNGDYVEGRPQDPQSSYGTPFNWVRLTNFGNAQAVEMPKFERDIIFADPESDQWNVGVMPPDIIDQIKTKLQEKKAPVHVVYNHYGYWHAVMIVGFDDQRTVGQCPFVEDMRSYQKDQVKELEAAYAAEIDPARKATLKRKLDKTMNFVGRLEKSYAEQGGCHPRGVFFVRDSIYTDPDNTYTYDSAGGSAGVGNYSKRVIYHEYDWVRYLANHVTQVYVK